MAEPGKYLIGESLREKLKSTISKVDSLAFGGPVSRIPTVLEDGGSSFSPKIFRVCTAAGSWPVDTSKSVTYYGVTATPNTVSVINQLVSLPAPKSTATSRIVNVAKDGTQWYLVSFQMSAKTAVMATATQTITFIGTSATSRVTFISADGTQTITYATPGSDVSVVTNISATLNTTDCGITVNKTTTTIKTVGSTQTATTVSAAGTQTATIMSMSGTQTAVLTTGTFTATFISLEI
jgi:hypothetical protein